jgi:hypothetical protein
MMQLFGFDLTNGSFRSHSHHDTLENDPEILWFEQQKELHRKKRDISVTEINIPGNDSMK